MSDLTELLEALVNDVADSEQATERLIAGWYTRHHFVLFKKNQRVTNLQLAELRSLVRNFCHPTVGDHRVDPVYFSTTGRGREYLRPAVDQLYRSRVSASECAVLLYPILQRLVLADSLMTSLILRPPRNLDIDLRKVCAYSGYVHSCGDLIYKEHLEAADADVLKSAIVSHVQALDQEKRVFFSVFSHEDHTTFDRVQEEALREGLDGVKVYLEKLRVGSRQLVEILRDLSNDHRDLLVVPPAGDWSRTHMETRSAPDVDPSRSLWLIADDDAAPSSEISPRRHLICYDQRYRNGNCLHLMDEGKPAFTSATTVPHTLLGAMVNLTLPWKAGNVAIVDPFCGVGTTSLEMLKWPQLRVDASDVDPFTILAANDNAEFFGLSLEGLAALDQLFEALEQDGGTFSLSPQLPGDHPDGGDQVRDDYAKAIAIRDEISRVDAASFALPDGVLQRLEALTFEQRMVFYLIQRTLLRHQVGLERGAGEAGNVWTPTLRAEARLLRRQLKSLVTLRQMSMRSGGGRSIDGEKRLIDYTDRYSAATTQPWRRFSEVGDIRVRDVRELPQDSYDIVVADPPYGLNVEASFADLGELYNYAISAMVGCLRKTGGHLVFCVPERSHVGAQTPFFASKDYCRERVVTEASAAGYKMVDQNSANFGEWAEVSAPYYWESTRALRRAVLHFELLG